MKKYYRTQIEFGETMRFGITMPLAVVTIETEDESAHDVILATIEHLSINSKSAA